MNQSKPSGRDIPTILIVDDTPSNLSVVVTLFENRGYRVAIAQDGEEGLQRAQLVQPDLILLDVMMPGMDGFEACKRLKEQQSTRDIPVIFMTALASSEHKVRGFQAGAVDYVTKPLQIDEVMARVDTHLKLNAAQKQLAEHNEELERRVAERTAELAASEREFRTLAENQPDNLARYDKQCRILYMNPRLERVLGKNLGELIGKTPLESMHASLYKDYQARLLETIETGQPCEMELTLPDRGEGVRFHLIRIVAERDADGEIVGALTIGRDITERKLAERELRLLNLAMNTSSEAAFLVDAQGRFVYVNEEACRSLGYSREELLTMTPVDIDPDITGEVLAGLLDSIFTHGPSTSPMESRHRTRDGRIFPIEIVASPLKLEGQDYCMTMVRDITERKRAERELLLLNRALDNAFDATYLIDEDMHLRYVNEAAVRALGYSREELLAMTLPDIDPNLKPDMLKAVMTQTDALGRFPGIIETQHRRKDGSVFPIEVGATVFDYEGERLHLTTVRDISERKEAERRLHQKEQAIRAVVENSPDTVIRYDNQCRRIYLNPAMEKIFGQTREQLHGTSPAESSPLPALYFATIKKTLETGREQRMESSFRNLEGETRWVDLRLAPEFDADGKVATVLVIGRDFTERKRAEDALAEREQRYHEIFDNAVEGMYLLEVTEDGRFRNLDINPALAASTGIPREAMIGQFVDDTVPEEVGKQIVEKYRRCIEAGTTITENIELDLPGGRRYYLSTITPIRYAGHIHRLIGISRDITELKKAERALEESRAQLRGLTARREKAREEERKYIAREVHDELGQILTGLQLNVSVLTHKFAADSPALREQLQESRALTDRALAVARNVASALRPAALDMGIVSALEWLVGRFGKNTGIHCEVHAEDMDIQLDESQAIALFRIVQESLTNVARHAKADRIDIDFGMIGDDYSLKVRDNGTGFDEKTARADSFGLVGMRERALLLGGEIFINSKPGEGTEVEVRIPAHNVSRLS